MPVDFQSTLGKVPGASDKRTGTWMTDIAVRDMRRAGFAWLGNADMRALRGEFDGADRKGALALYTTMVEAANAARADSFKASRARLGKAAGMSPRSVDLYAGRLETIGLLAIKETPGEVNTWILLSAPDPRSEEHSPLAAPSTPPSQPATPVKEEGKKEPSSGGGAEHPLFDAWLDHHMAVTTHTKPKLGTARRRDIAKSFAARLADQLVEANGNEQAALDRMKAANHGAQNDTWRREQGYTTAESILRPTKFGQLVDRGMKALRDEQDKGEGQGSGKWD